MTDTYKILGQTVSSTIAELTIYTVPQNKSVAVSAIQILNTGLSTATYTLSFVKSADVASSPVSQNYQKAIYNRSIPVGEVHEIKGGITLSAGDQVRILSNSNSIVASIYGVEME